MQKMPIAVGKEIEVGIFEIERGSFEKFAKAVCFPENPAEECTQCRESGRISLPSFVLSVGWGAFLDCYTKAMPSAGVHGSTSFEYIRPINLGDLITVKGRLISSEERKGRRAGEMMLDTFELDYRNQKGEEVARSRMSFIRYQAGEAKFD